MESGDCFASFQLGIMTILWTPWRTSPYQLFADSEELQLQQILFVKG